MSSAPEGYRNLHHEKLDCGKSLLELSTYDGIAWWWNAHFMFYTTLDRLQETGPGTKILRSPLLLRYLSAFGLYLDLVYSFLLKYLVRVLRWGSERQVSAPNPSERRVLFVSTDTDWRSVTDHRSKRSIKSDALFHSTINLLKERCEFVGTYPIDLYPIRGLKAAREKWMKGDFRFVSLNSHWHLGTWLKERKAAVHFRKVWKEIKDDQRLGELCRINGVDLTREVRFNLGLHFLCTLPLAVKYAEMGSQLIQAERPNLFLIKNEYGWRERGYAVIASKKQDIPTVALQHGNIYPRHHGYFYLKTEVSKEGKVDSPYCPLPDTTLVYGHYYRRLLTGVSAYSESSIRVTGQPRYDVLADPGSLFPRAEYQRVYNIDPSDQILLWTTQSQGLSDEENERTWKAVFRTMQQLEDVTLVIKQHPRERAEYTRRIRECMKGFNITTVIAPKDSDTYAHLACCDVMMAKFSTTVTEAVAMDKPVIILNLGGEPDRVEYVRQGVAEGVYRGGDLASAIERALAGSDHLKKNREKFKEEYLLRCDGRATERVGNTIEAIWERPGGSS